MCVCIYVYKHSGNLISNLSVFHFVLADGTKAETHEKWKWKKLEKDTRKKKAEMKNKTDGNYKCK